MPALPQNKLKLELLHFLDVDAEAEDSWGLDFQVILHTDLDGLIMGAALEDDEFVILHSVVEDRGHAV